MTKNKFFTTLYLLNCLFVLLISIFFIINTTSALILKESKSRVSQNFLKESSEKLQPKSNVSNSILKYQVFRIVPHTTKQLAILNGLYKKSADLQLDFWKAPTNIGVFADVMVNPKYLNETKNYLNENDMDFSVIIKDVEQLIMQREKSEIKSQRHFSLLVNNNNPLLMSFFSKRMNDEVYSSRNKAKYVFGDYHSYNDMLKWMSQIESYYPHMTKVFTIGTTYENRPIRGIKIGSPINDVSKRAIWIDGGMHAREWAAIHTALYFIEQLISLYGADQKITSYVDNLNFYIVPVANPDGFEYSRSDLTPQTRFWRKNRGEKVCKKDRWRRNRCCSGVDLNRNFDFHWGEIGSSDDLCSDIFQGKSAFSEPESRAIRDKLLSPELNGKLDAFITLHTYSQMWIHPYNHERKSFPDDINELKLIGKKGVNAIENVYGTKFRFGTGADILYPSAGGSDDWAKAHARVKFVYLLELRPGEDEWDGFLLDRRQLLPTGRETWEGVKVVIDAVLKRAQPVPRNSFTRPTIPPTLMFPTQSPPTALPSAIIIPPTRFSFTNISVAPRFTPRIQLQTQTQVQLRQPQESTQTKQSVEHINTTIINSNELNNNNNINISERMDASFLRNSLHEKLVRLRESQMQAKLEYERKVQQAEQQRQLIFWQNQQNRLHLGCSDRSPWCKNWIWVAPQICRTSTVYMQQDCRSTCGFCTQQN